MPAYPPPLGVEQPSKPHTAASSLPARPPPLAASRGFKPAFQPTAASVSSGNGNGNAASGSFTGFAPRAIASSSRPYRTSSPTTNVGPPSASTYSGQATYNSAGYQQNYQSTGYYAQGFRDEYAQSTPPQIRNPFAPPTTSVGGASGSGYVAHTNADPEMEAQIAQWQSAYLAKDENKVNPKPGNIAPPSTQGSREGGDNKASTTSTGKPLTVQRSGGGQKWSDNTLLEWDPAHHRIFVGNLAGEVTDDSLLKAFAKYPSVQKARVIRDKVTTKSKGFGFVSFSDSDDYFKAARDMQGKYIGSHPVKIKKSTTEIKAVPQKDNRFNNRRGNRANNKDHQSNSAGILGPSAGGGISKKHGKTKGGLKLLG